MVFCFAGNPETEVQNSTSQFTKFYVAIQAVCVISRTMGNIKL